MTNVRKILFIDDEENILSSLRRIFRREAIEAFFTTDPEEVFRLVASEKFAVVVSDQRMPKLDGVEVLKRVRAISPETVRIMLTGYADIKSAMRAVNDGNVFRFLGKPWNEEELKIAIDAGLAQYELMEENRRLQALTRHQNMELTKFNEDLENTVAERTAEIEKLNQNLKSAFYTAIKILGSLGGILDPNQEGHSRRVAKIAGHIAKGMALPETDIFEIQVAAFIHNTGDLSTRRSQLTPAMRPLFSSNLSAKIASLIPNIGKAPVYVLHQLERYDGKGQPNGFAGNSIPMGSRILAVAAAYDRLLHFGEMRMASPLNALTEIKDRARAEFDPEIVDALADYVQEHLREMEAEFELCLGIMELQPGMILSRPVQSRRGETLVAKDMVLNDEILEGLWHRQLNERPISEVYVYKSTAPSKLTDA